MPKTKKEFTQLLAQRMGKTENEAAQWVEAYTDTLVEIFKTGEGVTINGLGGFYLERRRDGAAFKFNHSQKSRKL